MQSLTKIIGAGQVSDLLDSQETVMDSNDNTNNITKEINSVIFIYQYIMHINDCF